MKITKEQKQQLIDLNDSRVNEILGVKELELGTWYKKKSYGDLMFYFNGKYTNKNNENNYGFGYDGIFQKEIGVYKHEVNKYYEATHEEVEQALINEAKRRGFNDVGELNITIFEQNNKPYGKGYFGTGNNTFILSNNSLYLDGVQIFKDGVWAEIIDEKAELKEEIKELRNKLKNLEEKL